MASEIDAKVVKQLVNAFNRDKQGRFGVSKRSKLIRTLKSLDSNMALTDFILVNMLGMDANDVVDYFKGENYGNLTAEWRDGQKSRIAEVVKRSGLDGQKLVSAVRAVLTSKTKPEIMSIATLCLVNILDNGEKNVSTEASKKEMAERGAKLKFENRMALVASIADNPGLDKNQKRSVKVAISESKGIAKTTMDVIDILIAIMKGAPAEEIENALRMISEFATFESRKMEGIAAAKKCELFRNEDSRKAVVETLSGTNCVTPENFIAIAQAGLANKERPKIEAAPTTMSDAEKVALVNSFNRNEIAKTHPKTVEAAKRAVMRAETHAEQVVICQLFLSGCTELEMRKGAKISAVNGTRKLVAVEDDLRQRVVEALKNSPVVPGEYAFMYEKGIRHVKDQKQLVQMLMTAIVLAPKVLVEKLLKSWEAKSETKTVKVKTRKKQIVILEAANENEKKAAIEAVIQCPTVSKSDINAATWALTEAATQVHIVMILTAIVEGRSARNIKRALTETHLHPVTDIPSPDLISDICNSISHSKVAPGKQSAAIDGIKKSKRMSRIAAILASIVANKSPPKIINATRLGDEFQVYVKFNKEETTARLKQMKAFEKQFQYIIRSTTLQPKQIVSAIKTLSRPFTAPLKCETLLRILEQRSPKEIEAAGDSKPSRVLTLKDKSQFCQRIGETSLWRDHKKKLCSSIKKAKEKKDVAQLLELEALPMLEHVTPAEMDAFDVAMTECTLLIDEKKTYVTGWVKKVENRKTLFNLLLAILLWQEQQLHWVGVAYESIFQGPLIHPMSSHCMENIEKAIEGCKHPSNLKKAAKEAVTRAKSVAEVVQILAALVSEKSEKEISRLASSKKKMEFPDVKGIFFPELEDQSDDEGDSKKKKKKKKPTKRKSLSKKDKERDIHIGKLGLEKQVKFDTSIVAVLRNSIISVIHTNVRKEKQLNTISRIVGILSQSTRYNDKAAKTEEASRRYIEMCHAIVEAYGDFDDADKEKAMNDIADAKYVLAATMKLRDLVGQKAVTDGFVDDEEFETFAFSPNKDMARPMDAEDKGLVVDHLGRHPFASEAQKTAAKKVILGSCNSRKQALLVLKLLDDGGTPRQIAAITHRLQQQKHDEIKRAAEVNKKKAAARAEVQRQEAKKLQEFEVRTKTLAEMIEKLSGLFRLSDYQRTAAMRMCLSMRNYNALGALIEGLLANLSGSQLRAIERSNHKKLDKKRLISIIDVSKLTPEAKAAAMRRLEEEGIRDDQHRVQIVFDAMKTACAELDAEAELEAERLADRETAKNEAPVQDGVVSARERTELVAQIAKGLMHHPERRLLAIKCTTHVKTYYNLAGILFSIIMGAADDVVEKTVSNMKLIVNIPQNTAHSMSNELRTSHMLTMFHGQQANELYKVVQQASTYEAVAKALAKTIADYGNCLDSHAPSPPQKQKPGGKKGGASYRRFKANSKESEEEKLAKEVAKLKMEPAKKIYGLQKERILTGIKQFKYLTKGAKFTALHYIEDEATLVVEVVRIIEAAFLANAEILERKRQKQEDKQRRKEEKRKRFEEAKQKTEAERAQRKADERASRQKAKEDKRTLRQSMREKHEEKRKARASHAQFEVIFDANPMGMGINPPHNRPLGSVVTVVAEGGQAAKSGLIRPGDAVISIGEKNVTELDHDATIAVIKAAARPLKIIFERAPYHVHPNDSALEEDIKKIFQEIEEANSVDKVDEARLIPALKKIKIDLGEEEAGLLLGDISDLLVEENFEFEELLHHAYDLTDHADEVAEAHADTSESESDIDSEEEEENEKENRVRRLWETMDADGTGSVDTSELKNGFAKVGIVMNDDQVDDMLSHIDEDASGHVTFDEFLAYASATMMDNDRESDSSDSDASDLEEENDIGNDPAVKLIKSLAAKEHFGLGSNPHDYVDDANRQKAADLINSLNNTDMQSLLIQSRHLRNSQETLNLYENVLYAEVPEYFTVFSSLRRYKQTGLEKEADAATKQDDVDTADLCSFVSDEEDIGEQVEEVLYAKPVKRVHKPKLPHNLQLKHKKKKSKPRMPNKVFTVDLY